MFITTIIKTKQILQKDGVYVNEFGGFNMFSQKLTSVMLENELDSYDITETDQFFNLNGGDKLIKSFQWKSWTITVTVYKL